MPVLLPLPEPLTIAHVHFGVVAVMTMEFALLTPPVGPNFFDRAGILRCPLSEVVRGLRPFIVIMALLLILATDVPVIATFLPDLV